MPGFGDIWGEVNEGGEANQNLVNNYYHNMAMSALTSAYGPQAGDPQAALQAQQYNYLAQQNPQLIQQQNLENQLNAGLLPSRISAGASQAAQQGTAAQYAAQTMPGAANAANAQSATTVATQPAAVQTSFAAAKLAAANAALAGLNAQQQQAYTHIRGALTFANAAEAYVNAGMQPEQAFQTARTLAEKESGANPADIDAVAAQLHDGFIANPANVIGQLRQGSTSALQTQLMPASSEQQIAAMKAGLDAQQARIKIVTDLQGAYGTADKQYKDILGSAGPVGAAANGIDIANQNLDAMSAMVPKLDPNNLARVLKGEHIPGSLEDQFLERAKSVDGALSLDTFQAARAASGGNLGFRTQNEFNAAGHSIANFSLALDPKQLAQQIANAKSQLAVMRGGVDAAIKGNAADYPHVVQRRQALEKQLNDSLGASYDPGAAAIMTQPPNISPLNGSSPAPPASGGPAAPSPASSQASDGAAPNFYTTSTTQESGGKNIPEQTGATDAFGYHQITGETWDGIRAQNPELNLPTDIRQATQQQQDQAYHAFVGANVAKLADAGIPITDKNVFMSSFLGRTGGPAFLTALAKDPTTLAAPLFPREAVANPTIFYNRDGSRRTLQQVYDVQTAKFGSGNTTGFGPGETGGADTSYNPGTTATPPVYPPPNVQPPNVQLPNFWTGQTALLSPPALPPNPYAGGQPNALGDLLQRRAQQPQIGAAEPAQTQPSGVANTPSSVAELNLTRSGAPAPALSQAQIRARIPDKVMDGRALLAKYLSPRQSRSA